MRAARIWSRCGNGTEPMKTEEKAMVLDEFRLHDHIAVLAGCGRHRMKDLALAIDGSRGDRRGDGTRQGEAGWNRGGNFGLWVGRQWPFRRICRTRGRFKG